MDDYNDIIKMLEKIKNNSKAISYIKCFLKTFIEKYCWKQRAKEHIKVNFCSVFYLKYCGNLSDNLQLK